MKITIERKMRRYNKQKMLEFFLILNAISTASDEEKLREAFNVIKPNHFQIGFGANHMWLAEDDVRFGIVKF